MLWMLWNQTSNVTVIMFSAKQVWRGYIGTCSWLVGSCKKICGGRLSNFHILWQIVLKDDDD